LRPAFAAATATPRTTTAAAVLPPLLLLLFLGRLHHARAPAAHLYVIQFPNVVVVREQRLERLLAAVVIVLSTADAVVMPGVLLAHDRVRIRIPLHARRVPVQLALHE